jgi:hypothetical protein
VKYNTAAKLNTDNKDRVPDLNLYLEPCIYVTISASSLGIVKVCTIMANYGTIVTSLRKNLFTSVKSQIIMFNKGKKPKFI